jgi:hypothetical protein
MKQMILSLMMVATLVAVIGCGKKVMVPVPPRIDLETYETIGLVEFSSNTEGDLDQFASQKFLQTIQSSQPSVVIIELGDGAELLESVGHDEMNYKAIKAIGEEFELDAILVGDIEVTDVKPRVNLYDMVTSMSVTADVEASLTVRLYDTERGATLWTKSAQGAEQVASIGVSSGFPVRFDAEDPESSYGKLVNGLVYTVTDDFRVHYVRQ